MRRTNLLPIGHRVVATTGYISVKHPAHPRADVRGYVFEHVLIAERALGRPFRRTAPVHHMDRNRANNRGDNLVLCHDEPYHRLLHVRQAAYEESGHADWRKCAYCGGHDDPSTMLVHGRKTMECYAHAACRQNYGRRRYAALKARDGAA